MTGKCWRVSVWAFLFGLVVLCATRAENVMPGDAKPTDEGKAEEFKGKAFDLKEKGEAAILLAFKAGKKVSVTVKSDKNSDINLFIYDAAKKLVVKDDSPGPDCDVKFTPKADGKLTLVVRNLGPGENRSTLKVSVSKE